MKNNILITGGAGYIGSTVARLLEKNNKIFIIDNLVSGNKKLLKKKYTFYRANFGNKNKLKNIINKNKINIIIHLAASLSVEESQKKKKYYYKNNFLYTKNLIDVCNNSKFLEKIIFSSTCAIYGALRNTKKSVNENTKAKPISYYGQTKKLCENYIVQNSKKKYVILRYFNVVGSEQSITCGMVDKNSNQLFANLNRSIIKKKNHINIYGSNYKTKDGTCIRDYIHVSDIAYIHKLCIEYLEKKKPIILNCGYKKGYSVKEIIGKYEKIFKIKIKKTLLPRRSGDPAKIICDNSKIKEHLNWKPKHNNLEKMIKSSYKWHKKFFL